MHSLSSVVHSLPIGQGVALSTLALLGIVANKVGREALFGYLSLLGHSLASVDLMHLVLVVHFIAITDRSLAFCGGLQSHLMLLFLEKENLLDLLLGEILIDHFLLSWEIVAFDHLFATFDLKLLVLRLWLATVHLVSHCFLVVAFIHVLMIVFLLVLLSHLCLLGGLKHHELISLLLSEVLPVDLHVVWVDSFLIQAFFIILLVLISTLVLILLVLSSVELSLNKLL